MACGEPDGAGAGVVVGVAEGAGVVAAVGVDEATAAC